MLRTHTCGELRLKHATTNVTIAGWVQTIRDKGGVLWIDLRDRYGLTQLILEEGVSSADLFTIARSLGREFVVQATGTVVERKSKNPNIPTGDIEIRVNNLTILNPAKLPPFLIEDETDGGDDLRLVRVSSAMITDTSFRMRRARSVMSSRLPIGVGTM